MVAGVITFDLSKNRSVVCTRVADLFLPLDPL